MPYSHWYSIENSKFDLSAPVPVSHESFTATAHKHKDSPTLFTPSILQRLAALKVQNESAARKRVEAAKEAAQRQKQIRSHLDQKLTRAAQKAKANRRTFLPPGTALDKKMKRSASSTTSATANDHEKRHVIAGIIGGSPRKPGKRSKVQIHPEQAAIFIQRAWVRIRLGTLFFSLFHYTKGIHCAASEEEIQAVLTDKRVIRLASQLFERCDSTFNAAKDSKVFLSMFLFLNQAESEGEMHKNASTLFAAFTQTMQEPEKKECFIEAFVAYKEQFNNWVEQDRLKLVQEMQSFQQDLEALRHTVEPQADYQTDWKPKIDAQQKMITEKLRVLQAEPAECLQAEAKAEKEEEISIQIQPLNTPSTTQSKAQSSPSNANANSQPSLPTQTSTPFLFGSISKHKILHEIYMQQNFQIQDLLLSSCAQGQYSSFQAMIKDQSKKLHEWISRPDFSILEAISYLSQRLQELAPQRPSARSIRQEIADYFDLGHISVQIERSLFDLRALVVFSCKIMAKLCAPIRDEEVSKLLKGALNDEPISDLLVSLIQLIDIMTFDMINFFTQTIRAHVAFNIVEYERSITNNLLTQHDKQLIVRYREANPIQASDTKSIISHIYCDILKGVPDCWLESLSFDTSRIESIRKTIHQLATQGAIGIILKSQLGITQATNEDYALLITRQTSDTALSTKLTRTCQRIEQGKDTLYELFRGRVIDLCRRQFVYQRYSLVNTGLETFESRIKEQLIEPFMKVFDLNWRIYSDAYAN